MQHLQEWIRIGSADCIQLLLSHPCISQLSDFNGWRQRIRHQVSQTQLCQMRSWNIQSVWSRRMDCHDILLSCQVSLLSIHTCSQLCGLLSERHQLAHEHLQLSALLLQLLLRHWDQLMSSAKNNHSQLRHVLRNKRRLRQVQPWLLPLDQWTALLSLSSGNPVLSGLHWTIHMFRLRSTCVRQQWLMFVVHHHSELPSVCFQQHLQQLC